MIYRNCSSFGASVIEKECGPFKIDLRSDGESNTLWSRDDESTYSPSEHEMNDRRSENWRGKGLKSNWTNSSLSQDGPLPGWVTSNKSWADSSFSQDGLLPWWVTTNKKWADRFLSFRASLCLDKSLLPISSHKMSQDPMTRSNLSGVANWKNSRSTQHQIKMQIERFQLLFSGRVSS